MFNIIAFLGPSGAGKSTLQGLLGYKPIVTWTSRYPRRGEIDGKHYHFANREKILNMYNEGLLLEYTQYKGNVYGIGVSSIDELIDSKSYGSIVVDANGAIELKKRFPNSILVLGVIAPYGECEQRLLNRENENIDERLSTYSKEVNYAMELSDIIINNSQQNWEKTSNIIKLLQSGLRDLKI